ncbi:MAG: polymerase sigma factor [Verrucomicrobiota bacterium]|jgi:RNA polymerase sigma-70 factor (ECF subfamily)
MATSPQSHINATPAETGPSASIDLPTDFTEIYAAHAQAIHYLALRLTGDAIQAQDVTHDVFLKAFRNLDGFRGASAVRTWLYRITLNHCAHLRQSWAARKIQTAEDDGIFDRVDAQAPNPLHELETKELGERIQRTLDSLPSEYSLLLLLVADQELSYEQVAELTDQSPDAVRGKLHRARKAFTRAFARTA